MIRSREKSSPEESSSPIQATKDKVKEMIKNAKSAGYQKAAENLEYWLAGSGHRKLIPSSWIRRERFIHDHLNGKHFQEFLKGAEKRVKDGRLKNKSRTRMHWTDSINAPASSDLYYALGGWTIRSDVEVFAESIDHYDGSALIKFLSWEVSCTDRYNWDPGKATFIQLYGDISDDELKQLEKSGPKPYDVEIRSFDALKYIKNTEVSISL